MRLRGREAWQSISNHLAAERLSTNWFKMNAKPISRPIIQTQPARNSANGIRSTEKRWTIGSDSIGCKRIGRRGAIFRSRCRKTYRRNRQKHNRDQANQATISKRAFRDESYCPSTVQIAAGTIGDNRSALAHGGGYRNDWRQSFYSGHNHSRNRPSNRSGSDLSTQRRICESLYLVLK